MTLRRIGNGRGVLRVLALPATALALAAGAVVSAPAASASIRPACQWQPLYLLNGWQSAGPQFGTGDPVYCVSVDGSVYLAGSLAQPSAGNTEFAVLPPQALPPTTLNISVYTFGGTTGALTIAPDGEMRAVDDTAPPGSAARYTSLAGVSFPAVPSNLPVNTLSTINGWQSGASFGTGDPGYYVTSGIVHLTGSVDTAYTGSMNPLALLPVGAQPDGCTIANVFTSGGVPGTIEIHPTGQIFAYNASNTADQLTSLAGIAFPAAGANWQQLTLMPGWQQWACSNTDHPSYAVINHVVYLNGGVIRPSPGSNELAVLPLAARPTHSLWLALTPENGGSCYLNINPDGSMFVFNNTKFGCSLGAVSYQESS